MPNSTYKGRIRIRVNGLLVKDNALLMVRMRSPVTNQQVWMPPGGGLQFKESMEACLKREFLEETGLQVEVRRPSSHQ
ncbi:MAG: NUDIX domain-containing protein [Balneolaceae bacterium]|nr:NUDIX domain-containing protein [Balneolaceae bacterium]